MEKFTDFDSFRASLGKCEQCGLCATRQNTVCDNYSGEGKQKIMFLGEAPGKEEDLLGTPFAGQAGKNLERLLMAAGINRATIYIGNTVKCRPVKGGKSGYINRKPTPAEINACHDWLMSEIAVINPRIIVTLGAVPLSVFLGVSPRMEDYHGREILPEEIKTQMLSQKQRLYSLYHPAAMIYDRKKEAVLTKDMLALSGIIKAL